MVSSGKCVRMLDAALLCSALNSSESLDKLRNASYKPEVHRFLEAAEPIQTITEDVSPHLDEVASGKSIVLGYMLMNKSSTRFFSA